MKVSQLYGKQILSDNKKRCGYIMAISCVGDRIEGYICCNEQENEFFVDSAGAKASGEKMLVTGAGKQNKNAYRLRLGRAVYSETGKFLGHIEDLTVKSNRIVFAHVGKRKYEFNRLCIGDVAILKSDRSRAETAAKDMFIDAVCCG